MYVVIVIVIYLTFHKISAEMESVHTHTHTCICIKKHILMGDVKEFSSVVLTICDFEMLALHKLQLHSMWSFNMCDR